MPLTEAQRQKAKKHMGVWPNEDTLDASISALEDGGVKESNLVAAITLCDNTLQDVQDVWAEADELVEGGGARFNYGVKAGQRKAAYRQAREDLARMLSVDLSSIGGGSVATGWRVH